ncbi:uncharacterized protein BDR25DRAFT_324880 [Lindgomyces ingoldianus]|uniref:Uncharacterized protein n=1 Tax=Lindgomyces ingoldianus TaxID=673940 RepID=A0ACB6QZV4_9PLEO|nr:uncharacterized protein BDR25DRAFT_324880 [Lindgomyces ingoldianus]KAF2471726.1 hypothetical protein BDR25DRAFT_324880 [Lindgomyces ingoldianus]
MADSAPTLATCTTTFDDISNNYGIVAGPVSGSAQVIAPPRPFAKIPFPRDSNFVERGTILDQVRQRCAVPGLWAALVGLGGVGKSQLAIEYANQARERLAETWVLWVMALLAAIGFCSYGKIGAVLRSIKHHALGAALKVVEQRDIITVKPMDEAQARTLFEKKLEGTRKVNSIDVDELTAALEYMPLAIMQAAAYLAQRGPRCPVRQYLYGFKKSERKQSSLLNRDGGQLRRDWEANNSIIVTWQISFEHIQQTRPSAAELLSLMSFFDRQGIPEELLRSRATQAVLTLRDFYLISVETGGASFEMDLLVRLAMRKWLDANGRLEQWKQQFISGLCAAFPTGEYENWARCRTLFPHVKSAAGQQPERNDSLGEFSTILHRAAWYAWRMGNGTEAGEMSVQAMKARKRAAEALEVEVVETFKEKLGPDDPLTLTSQWEKAKTLFVEVVVTLKKKLGADRPSTLTSMANLASTYRNQGRREVAEALEVEAVEIPKKKLGADHPSTLTSITNLALTYVLEAVCPTVSTPNSTVLQYTDFGHPPKGSVTNGWTHWLEVEVMETRKTKLEDDHPDTLTSMANLASTYLETFKKLGEDHPDTLTSMNNLAFTWKHQGRDAEAAALMRQCVQSRCRKLGVDHPAYIPSSTALAEWEVEQVSKKFLALTSLDALDS